MNSVAPPGAPAPGRDSDLPYYLSEFETPRGVSVVAPNCLICHAGTIDGELVLGLGTLTIDFGAFAAQMAAFDNSVLDQLVVALRLSEDEAFELRKFYTRMQAVAPYVQADTVGVNAADNLAAILFAHRDRHTLEWYDEPLLEPPPQAVVPVDVPPWWRMAHKSSMFYTGSGRGDHSRIMMGASTLCVDDVEVARAIDVHMPDVAAWVKSLEAPEYPYDVDADAAARGELVFQANCAQCHGTYGDDAFYPNLLVHGTVVGTDTTLVVGAGQLADRFQAWFNEGFYGEVSRLEVTRGYVAPPLDGIWATAPFLHNGSIPTLEALLNSPLRPVYWTWSFNTSDYDKRALGWNYQVREGKNGDRNVYDTTAVGYTNVGHTFGDALSDAERADLLEYLKTL